MKQRLLIIALLIAFIRSAPAYAQEFQVSTPYITSFAESLAAHGVTDLSEQSLIAALSHSDPQVRTIAAMKLVEDHHDDAAPAIESALSREQDIKAQIGFSEALWSLHDDQGIAHFRAMCSDSSLSFMDLISVVDALRLTHSPAGVCADTFFTAMNRSKEPVEIAMGETRLSVIYCDSTPDQAHRVLTALRLYLADRRQEAVVRLGASSALADIGSPECAEAIRTAISQESHVLRGDLEGPGAKPALLRRPQTMKCSSA